jgi:hypothetical protein
MIRNILLAKDEFYFNNRLKSSFIEFQLEMSNYVMCNADSVEVKFYTNLTYNEMTDINALPDNKNILEGTANYNKNTGYY